MSAFSQPDSGRSEGRRPAVIRLYVAGQLPHSLAAAANLRALCAGCPPPPPVVEVVDVLRDPERALRDGILATPTLVRCWPEPTVSIRGTLSDLERVRAVLGFPGRGGPGYV